MASKGVPLPKWDAFKETLEEFGFEDLCAERLELKQMKDTAEARMKEIDAILAPAMVAAGVKSVEWNGMAVIQADGRSASRIVPEKLLENGVTASQIEASTVPGHTYTYIQIKSIKGKE